MSEKIYDTIIIGGGIAGFQATLALKNFKRDVLWIGAKKFGEKIYASESVQNFPAFSGEGKALASLLERQSEHEDLPFVEGRIDSVFAMGDKFLLTKNGETYTSRTVILATGVELAGSLKGEREFLGRGVSYCAVCDGALYKGKKIAAVLSSKAFEEEAEYLAGFAENVYAVCRYKNPQFHAPNIEIICEKPLSIEGDLRVQKLVFEGRELSVDGIFLLKNSAPPSALVGGLFTEPDGHVKVARDMSTNLTGLFAAGDVTGRPYQFVKAAGEGLVAAYSAHAYLKEKKQ